MTQLENAIAEATERTFPLLAAEIREAKLLGAEKSGVVFNVTRGATGSALCRAALMMLVDRIWNE